MSMPIFSRIALVASLALYGLGAGPSFALDGTETPAETKTPELFSNPEAAMQAGLRSYKTGDVKSSVEALKYAADKGYPLAQWKLGHMYANGDGVARDDRQAYDYFLQIVKKFTDDEDELPAARKPLVSNAFVEIGLYCLNGIPSRMKPDPSRALRLFEFAATNFRNREAEYNLGRMYLDGIGTDANTRQGLGWLDLAARKGHYVAQAILGHVLFAGKSDLPPQRARGLAFLALANENADKVKDAWIGEYYKDAMASASESDREMSRRYIDDFRPKLPQP
jgi:TPR repeat protein